MLFINFVCLFYLMVLVASHTISKSIDRSDLFDDVASVDVHQPQKHPRRDKDNNHHLFWWRKTSVLKQKTNKSKSTTRTTKHVNNAKVKSITQMQIQELVQKEKKAKKIEKTKPRPVDDDWEEESDKVNVTSTEKKVKTLTTKLISTTKEAKKARSKKKKKKSKSKHTHRTTIARGSSDDPRDKHRRDLPVTNPSSNYLTAATAGYTRDPTLSHYYNMLAEMSTKLDKLLHLYSNSRGIGTNRDFTLPSLQVLAQDSNRFTDSIKNKVLPPDDFEGTDMLESLLSGVKYRAIEVIAQQTPALTDLITNAVITTTFTADPMLIHYDPHNPQVMPMDLDGAAPTLAPYNQVFIKKPVMNTVKSLKKGQYNDDKANYFVVQRTGTRRGRAVDVPPKNAGTTIGEQIRQKLKNMIDKVKQSVGSAKGHEVNATEWHEQKNFSLTQPASRNVTSTKLTSVSIKEKVNEIHPNKTTCLRPTNKVTLYTKLPKGNHRKGNAHSTKRHTSKHKKNRKKTTHNTSTTPITEATEDEDYDAVSLVEKMLSRDQRRSMDQLSTSINPIIERHYRRAVDKAETGSITDMPLDDIPSNYEDPNTDTPIDETSYEGLTKKISYNDFVDGYKHYLKFEKDMGHSNFSNMVRYQAHRHHDVDDIGKFILDKLPQLPITQERYKRDFFDDDDDDQDISTKSEESWFKKHFYYMADRSAPPKKFHSSQLVPLKSPLAARDGKTGNPVNVDMKKPKPKTHRIESQSADGEKMDDLEELARMLKRSSSPMLTLVSDTDDIPQNADDDVTSVRSARLLRKMFGGIKRTAKKSPRKHNIRKLGNRPVEDARFKRHEVNKKLKIKHNYVQRDEEEPTKSTVPSNVFDQVAADEQETKEKRDRIETTNATPDRAVEEGKGKKKLGFVNVELVPATTAGTLKKVKERGRFAKFVHNFRFRMKKPEKRQKRSVTRKQRCGLFKKIKEIFSCKNATCKKEHFPKEYGIVTRKISAYNPALFAKNVNEIKYEIPSITDYFRNTDYPDLSTAGSVISSTNLVDYWATKKPLIAQEPTVSRVQQMYEERKNNKNQKSNAEKIDQLRKEIENIEGKTGSLFDWSYDTAGRKLKDFEDALNKGYFPSAMTKSNILKAAAMLKAQSKLTTARSNNMNHAYTLVKKNSAVYERHTAPLDNSVTGMINDLNKKSYTKKDFDIFSLKPQYKDKLTSIPTVSNFGKDTFFNSSKSSPYDDFNDLIIWHSDILHSNSFLTSTTPPVKSISIKDDFAEFIKGNQMYAEHTFSKKVQMADRNEKDRHNVSKGGKETREIKHKGRNVKSKWDFRRDTYDNIAKRLDALLSRSSSTERYYRMSTDNYNKVMSYETPNLKDILTDTSTLPYEKDLEYLRDGMKITKNTLLPEGRSFTLSKRNKNKMTLSQQFHSTPLPMKHKDFDDFLKLNDIDVESVTALESFGTRSLISPTQVSKKEAPYNSGKSKSNKNHVDKSHQISKEILKDLYGSEDGVQKSVKTKMKHQMKPSRQEGDLPPNLLKGIQNRRKEVTVNDYDYQSDLPQLNPDNTFSYHGKNKETTQPDLNPYSFLDDAPDLQQEHNTYQEEMKDKTTTLKKPGKRNKFFYDHDFKHNKLFFGKDEEVSTELVLEPTKSMQAGKLTRISPPKRIIINAHSLKYDIVYGDDTDPVGMLSDKDRPAGTNALGDPEDPAQVRAQVNDQVNIPTIKDQEVRKGQKNIAGLSGSRTNENGRVSVKDTYHFLNSLLRQRTPGATEAEPPARPAGTLDFHNYFSVGVKNAQEFKDKLQRKRKEKRKGKRQAIDESYTAKNVAEIEVIVDLIKNPEAFEELSRSAHYQNTSSPVVNNQVKPINSIQVHIGVPRYGTECHSAKRSLQNIKKIFIAKLCNPVDLEYQVKSYLIPPSTVIPTGVYLLLDNNDSLDGNLVLKPIFHNIDVAVVNPREVNSVHKDYSTEKITTREITTTQTLSKLNKVTLTRDFVAAVNKHVMQLCELLAANDTHRVHARAANEEKPRRSLSWKRLKKMFRGDHVCDCNCRPNATMCKSCAASDKVMTDLIYEINSLIKYMNEHCTEIQTYFFKNPSGGKKLKDSVKLLDRNMRNYYKRVKGKCQGKSCDGFRFLNKRFFYSTPRYGYTDLLDYFPYGINSPIMEETTLTDYSRNDVFLDKNINIIDEADKFEITDANNKTQRKNVYSLDNVNVNIICKDNNLTTAKVTPNLLDTGGRFSYPHFTEPILVRVEHKLKKDSRHPIKYKKREVGQIDSPLNSDSSGSFWNDYLNKINESALIFVATGMIPDTGTSKVNNERNLTTVENINLPTEKASSLTTLNATNQYNNTTDDRLKTQATQLIYESIISSEAPSTREPLQEDLNELIKLLGDVYVKDFNDISMNNYTKTKKPVDTVKTTLVKNCTCLKDSKEKSKCKCAQKETADTYTTTDSTLTDSTSILLNCTTTDSLSNNYTTDSLSNNDTTDDILTDYTQILTFVPNISETTSEDWRSSTRKMKNLFPYLKKLKYATLGWFNYDKSKEGLGIDNSKSLTQEKDQLFRVMQVLGTKNKKGAYLPNHAKSQGKTSKENSTILIFNDDDEPFFKRNSKDNHTPDVDNSSGIDVLDVHSTVDASNNLLISLLKYESQKLAKEWKRYAGRNHNAKPSVDNEPKKEGSADNLMSVTVEAMNKTKESILDQESSRCDNATREKGKEKQKGREKNKEQDIQSLEENEIENKEEREIEKEIQNEKLLIKGKEKEIEKERQIEEKYKEKLRKLKEKGIKMAQRERGKESNLNPAEKEQVLTYKKNKKIIKAEKKDGIQTTKLMNKNVEQEGNQTPKSMDKNEEPGKDLSQYKTEATETTETVITKFVSILEPLRKLELAAPPPGKEGFINRILNKFNVSWCTMTKKQEQIEPIETWPLTDVTEDITVGLNDYYDSDAIMSVSLITGEKEERTTERRSIVEPMNSQRSDDGFDQPRRLCDLQDTFSYALRCLQQDKKWFQDYAKRMPCHRYMNTPKCFCIEPGKQDRGKITVFKEPKRKLRWDWKRNKRSLYVEEVEDPLNDDDEATDEELLDGNAHSLRDALISNDGFERMYKDEFGIYRIETRKKRSAVDAEAVIQGLKDLAPIKVPKNEIYVMPRDSVTITCALDASKGPINWSLNEGPIPDNAVAKGTNLAIQNVKAENSGNYTCSQVISRYQCFRSGALSEGKRERWTQLTVVRLPVFRIVTFLMYRCRPLCTAYEVGALRELGDHMTRAACPGSSCTVQVHRPTSLEDQTNRSSLASVFVDVAPARRAARCGVECARNMYCSLTRLIADNAATIATIPVIVSWKVRNTTLTPLVRQKIFVTQTSNIQEPNPLRTHAKWTSGELDVKMHCPAGYYLVPEMKLCVTNPVRFLPVIPRRVRRYDWWRPSYLCLGACVVVGAVCACGANALARGEGAAEGGRGNRVTALPCPEATGRRRISPSRVILPRLFRHASSRISQETKLDLNKVRLPPPPPPIDFDP